MELQNISNNVNASTQIYINDGGNKGVQLTFKNIVYKVENKKYKKQIKKQLKKQKNQNNDLENNNSTPPIIEKELTILNNVSGVIERGEFVALMGPSGSGKSTLLDILAQRKSTGKISGQLLVNGQEIGEAYKKYCSYVTQEDTLLQTSTVFETLKFYADLKLPDSSENEKIKRIEKILEELGLTHRTHSKIGGILPGGILLKGLSGGEKRRVSIGCGLITDPAIVMLDEPTSGLDSVAALQIMKCLLNLTHKGVTVICSIHQPRPEIFQLINKVMVIIKGKMIYSGNNILPYFEKLGYICPNNTNPADFILDSAVEIGDSESYTEVCNQWEKIWETEILNDIEQPPVNVDLPKTPSFLYQYWTLLNRTWRDFIRNQGNLSARVVTAIVTGILFGVCFANLKENEKDVQKILGTIFFLLIGLNLTPFAVISLFLSGRTLFNAERASKIYHSFPYYLSMVTVEALVVFLVAIINAAICYLFADLRVDANHFLFAMLVFFFVHLLSDFMICTLANVTGTSDMTFAYGSGVCVIWMLFAGFFVPVSQLPKSFGWLHHINPMFYSFASLVCNQYQYLPLECSNQPVLTIGNTTVPIPCTYTNGDQVLTYLGIDNWNRANAFGAVVGWTGLFFTTSYLALHYLNKEKR